MTKFDTEKFVQELSSHFNSHLGHKILATILHEGRHVFLHASQALLSEYLLEQENYPEKSCSGK
jgi:hypothetical protein